MSDSVTGQSGSQGRPQGTSPSRNAGEGGFPESQVPVAHLPNFGRQELYIDATAEDPDLVDRSQSLNRIDFYLRDLLKTQGRIQELYIATILVPNKILDYPSFRDLVVSNHGFRDLEHIFMSLGPNALGLFASDTMKLMLLGFYINKSGVTMYDERSGAFIPGHFDDKGWRKFCTRKTRYEFKERFERASAVTFDNGNGVSQEEAEEAWSAITRNHLNLPPIGASRVPVGDVHLSSSLSTIAHERSTAGNVIGLESRGGNQVRDNLGGTKGVPAGTTVKVKTERDSGSGRKKKDSCGSGSGDDDSDSGSSGDSGSTSDNGYGGDGGDDSPSDDESSDESNDSSDSDDESDSGTDASDDDSTQSDSDDSDDYMLPHSDQVKAFMRKVMKHEKADHKKNAKKKKSSRTPSRKSKEKRKKDKREKKHSSKRTKDLKSRAKRHKGTSSLRKRSVLTITPWDGLTPFLDIITKVRNFVEQQQGMYYILEDVFVKAYRHKKGYKALLKANDVSSSQFDADQRTLHAYLSAAFESYVASRDIMDKYRTARHDGPDGIKAFAKLWSRFGYGGDAYDAHLQVLRIRYARPYDVRYTGGLRKYVTDFEGIVSTIEKYRIKGSGAAKVPDTDNCHQLLSNLASERSIQHIYASAHTVNTNQPGNLRKLCKHIIQMAITQEELTHQHDRAIKRNARLAAIQEGDTDDDDVRNGGMDIGQARAMLGISESTLIPKAFWQAIPRDLKKKLMEIRSQMEQVGEPNSGGNNQRQGTNQRQGSRPAGPERERERECRANLIQVADLDPEATRHANMAGRFEYLSEEDDGGDELSQTDGSNDPPDVDSDQRVAMNAFADLLLDRLNESTNTIRANMTRTIEVDFERYTRLERGHPEVLLLLSRASRGWGMITADSGADTCILGQGFRIISTVIGQFANVVGFDNRAARKTNLPIGTGDTILHGHLLGEPDRYFEFIARFNQSVINADSSTTLASDSQVRHAGHIVDPVSTSHARDLDGNMGTQQMVLIVPDDVKLPGVEGRSRKIVIPLVQTRGLMTYENRLPTDDDYSRMIIVNMTKDEPWDPREHTESSQFVIDAAGIPRPYGDIETSRVAETAATATDDTDQAIANSTSDMEDNLTTDFVNVTLDDANPSGETYTQDATGMEVEDEEYFDSSDVDDDGMRWYFMEDGTAIRAKVYDENSDEDMPYFDCASSMKELRGHAFHLTIDFKAMLANSGDNEHAFIRAYDVDDMLGDLTFEELTGMVEGGTNIDTLAYTVGSIKRYQEQQDMEALRANFGYRPVDIILKTFENTTQYAKAFSPFPMHRHWKAMYKWFNLKRLPETICTDTALSQVVATVTGETCAQVFYGVVSRMINVYGMWSKDQASDAYRDFMREEGIPTLLHRDNSKVQKNDAFKELNRTYLVKDSWTEPYHPHQNPAETRAMTFLKRVVTSLVTLSGAPEGLWLYALKYAAMVNNWTSHESLGWKTPHEMRHGVRPDISPLLAYRFYQQVYYYVDDGFPDSGERLGYVIGVNENVGSHMTFDILTDDHQTIIPRSVLRPIDQPAPNPAIQPSEELDPRLRIQDRDLERARLKANPVLDEQGTDPDIFVDMPQLMHQRKKRKKVKGKAVRKHLVTNKARKNGKTREQHKHAPSNKKRKKIVRFKKLHEDQNPTSSTQSQEEDEQYVIDEIIDHRRSRHSGEPEVLVSWEDFDHEHDSWEPISVLKETAAETLAEYAHLNELSAQPGWEWTKSYTPDAANESTAATPPSPEPAPVEGGSKRDQHEVQTQETTKNRINTRSKAKTDAQKPKQADKRVTRSSSRVAKKVSTSDKDLATLMNNLMASFGLIKGNDARPYTLKNYTDFKDIGLRTEEEKLRMIPLETVTYEDGNTNVSTHLAKLLELQNLDKFIEKDDEWTVVKVLNHATRRVTRRLPHATRKEETVKDKHVRLQVMFMDGEVKWISMDAVLLQDPMPVIEYAIRAKITNKPNFKVVKAIMKSEEKMESYRKAFKAKVDCAPRYHFGVEIPRNVTHAALLDKINGNKLWEEATDKEMKSLNEHQVFRLATDQDDMRQYKRIPYQIIFDCKHDGRRKARLVAGGHVTAPPTEDVYSGVVGMDTVRLAFAIGAMQGLEVCAADVATAFLYGKTKEKVYILAGPEFGPELEGKRLIVQGGLYGLKTLAARYHETCSVVLRKIGFRPTKVDQDLWIFKKGDHYEYLATYVDDILAWGKQPLDIIREVEKSFKLRGIGFPDYYLGADVKTIDEPRLKDEGYTFGMSAKTYISNTLKKLGDMVNGGPFHKTSSPMNDTYHPEQEDTPLLSPENHSKYRAMIGSANWIVTLGRFDIAYATSTLARYSMAPREGHLIALKRLFGYLTKYPHGELLVNPRPFNHPPDNSGKVSWEEFYPDASEELPPDQPDPLPTKAQITIYVDADHAHDTVTRRSVTGILVFVNQTLVKYVSKRQKTVETSSYGSELVASRMATELAMEYRYAVRMMGVEVDGPVHMFGDNNSVIINTTLPSSMLKKKHQSIAYHMVRMAQASRVISFKYTPSASNWADVMTKPLAPIKLHALIKPWLFRRSGFI